MRREQLIEKILDIKRNKGWSWKHITEEIGGVSPILGRRCFARSNEGRSPSSINPTPPPPPPNG
jgi:hypothetical protein